MQFVDVTAAAGIHDAGISFGVSAGDFDGDGWVDLFTGGHWGAHPHLWRNLQNGTFADVTAIMQPPPAGDIHGGQWVDQDNDGLPELVLMRGANYGLGSEPKSVYKRFGTELIDMASLVGLDLPFLRGRTPLSVDYDDDGKIDIFLSGLLRPDGQSPPGPMLQTGNGTFVNWPPSGFFLGAESLFGVLGDLDGDHRMDILLHSYPTRAFAYNGNGIVSITASLALPPTWWMYDAVVADLTGDGENEIYVARDRQDSSFHLEGDRRLQIRAVVSGNERTLSFAVGRPRTVKFDWGPLDFWPLSSIYVGAGGYHPSTDRLHLDANDPANTGIYPHVAGQFTGICIGWDPVAKEWVVTCSSPIWSEAMMRVVAKAPISGIRATGWAPPVSVTDLLLERVGGVYVNRTAAAGIPASLSGRSVVAADFDNDMDLDLYVLTSTTSHNTANVLLENDGSGCFHEVPAGMSGAAGSSRGIGDSVVTFDYDRDGRVDLFMVNGDANIFRFPSDAFGDDGPVQLLRNVTQNSNHWLDIHLQGTVSNRDGIGARIQVTAGGITQVRENGGGMHRFSQNHGIHFGLALNPTADVVVVWPNGSITTVFGVAADQMLTVIQ